MAGENRRDRKGVNAHNAEQQPVDGAKLDGGRWPWIAATTAVIAVAISLRLALNFSHPTAPGTDAAYYPLQTRWLIEHGDLLMPAMPLVFWLNAFLTQVLMWVTGLGLDDAVLLGSRLIDGFAQPWVALPVMMLGYTWSKGRRSGVVVCASAAVLAVMSPPIIRMAGDFQKNSLGLVWMALCIWAMRESLAHPNSLWRWGRLAVFFLLAGVTHIGAFGITCVILGGSLLGYAVLGERRPTREHILFIVATLAGLSLILLAMCWIVPSQMQRLLNVSTMVDPHVSPASLALALIVYSMLAIVLGKLWTRRDQFERCDLAIVGGVVVGLVILVVPVLQRTWAVRFQLMTPVPAAVLLAFLVAKLATDARPRWARKALLTVVCLLALAAPFAMQGPVLSAAAADELRMLQRDIANPERTLVVAPHGLEFWAGFLMHTQARKGTLPENLARYDRVLILKPKRQAVDNRSPPPAPPERGRRRPPPHRRHGLSGVPDRGPPGGQDRELTIPDNARQIYNSDLFTLYEVPR